MCDHSKRLYFSEVIFAFFFIYMYQGGNVMLEWVITLGFVGCLGLSGGVFVHFVKSGLNLEDSSRIDPLPEIKE
ncbi:hypothetical protein ASG97_15355 [Bacillus sp. Soil745]|nr:hypothetical protein ASG97_15355 [Bacillus sp. Soil745]